MSMTDNAAKTCTKCGVEQSISCFGKDVYRDDGLCCSCKTCRNIANKRYYDSNVKEENIRTAKIYKRLCQTDGYKKKRYMSFVKRVYGVTAEDYNDIFIEQGGRCAVCGKHQKEFSKRLAIDHCHDTGKIRGLLCGSCNSGMGLLCEDIQLLRNAIKYLEMNR